MTEEESNIRNANSSPIEGLGWSIVLDPTTSEQVIDKIKNGWACVAALGRAEDTNLGEWPLDEVVEKALPDWLSSEAFHKRDYGFDTWCSDLEDREWIWWSCTRQDDHSVRIDLKAYAMPMSDWTLCAVIEIAGAKILSRDIRTRI